MPRLPLALLLIFSLTAPALAQQTIDVGRRFTLPSTVLGETRTVFVRVPANYDRTTTRYPVLYMTDAETQFVHTAATVAFLSRTSRMPDMIVVGVTNTDRTRDLTPTKADLDPGFRGTQFPTAGGANRFLDFFERELIPWVEKEYRVEAFRLFAGHSFGGLFAAHAFATRPALFNAVIAVSPSLSWDNDLAVREMKQLLASRPESPRTLVATVGNEGPAMQRPFDALRDLLSSSRPRWLTWDTRQFPDDDHGSVVLPSHEYALRKIFEGWQPKVNPVSGTYAGGLAGLEGHYAKLSGRLGWTVRPPEGLVNVLGYGELQAGRMTEALAYFEYNVAAYPASANVYDSLGEAQEKAGALDKALASYEKAVKAGEASGDPLLGQFRQHLVALQAKRGTKH